MPQQRNRRSEETNGHFITEKYHNQSLLKTHQMVPQQNRKGRGENWWSGRESSRNLRSEHERKNRLATEINSLRDLWDDNERCDTHVIQVLGRGRDTHTPLQIQEAKQTPKRINPKKSAPRHIVRLLKAKDKGNTLKAAREKHLFF